MLPDQPGDYLVLHQAYISRVDESITEHTVALVPPKPNEARLRLELVHRGQVETLIDSAQVPQIENVVELQRGTGQLLQARVVQLQGGLRDPVHRALDIVREVAQMRLQERRVDLLDGLFRGEGDVEGAVEGHRPRVHPVITATGRRYTTDIHRVDDVSQIELAVPLVELVALDEEFEERDGRLGAILVDCGHVQVIDKDDHFLAYCLRSIILDRLLLDILLDDVLEVKRGCL